MNADKKIAESDRGPKCPVCGHICDDMGDYAYVDKGDMEWDCDECGAVCTVVGESDTTFNYTTTLVADAALEEK